MEKKSYRGWGKSGVEKKVESITKHKTKPSKVLFAETAVGDADDDDDEEKKIAQPSSDTSKEPEEKLCQQSANGEEYVMHECMSVCVRYLISKLRPSLSSIEYRQLATCLDAHVVLA